MKAKRLQRACYSGGSPNLQEQHNKLQGAADDQEINCVTRYENAIPKCTKTSIKEWTEEWRHTSRASV